MSNVTNDILIEQYLDRAARLKPHLSENDVFEFERYLAEGYLEDAREWLEKREMEVPMMLDGRYSEVLVNGRDELEHP